MYVTNLDIYNSSLALIGETTEAINIEDYEERAPYIIASFCSLNSALDKKIRDADNLNAAYSFSPVYLSLEQEFPLCEKLVSAASLYTASMLVIDEDTDLSDSLYDKYCDNISSIEAYYSSKKLTGTENAIKVTTESISERYFFD